MPQSSEILLVAINANYQHGSFGLRYLYANLKELQPKARILEFALQKDIKDMVEAILSFQPKILGLGVYIWNARQMMEIVTLIKQIAPEICVILGGPEVSFESEFNPICQQADLVITGEADLAFYECCKEILINGCLPKNHFFNAPLPDLTSLQSPYIHYSPEDLKNRVISVETSRGCPFRCEYCLSSLSENVRYFDMDAFLSDMELLIQKGARVFKFIDRTFNIHIPKCLQLLEFFLRHTDKGLFLHFEMVPDRFPDALKELILRFPKGSLQFEIGIQTWNPEVAKNISREMDIEKSIQNLAFLSRTECVHTHADLIIGLPGEDIQSFAKGFDRLFHLKPNEIQVGILKRLKGTPITRHDTTYKMVYSPFAPYLILKNSLVDFQQMQKLSRFAKHWDLYANSGNFKTALPMLFEVADLREDHSIFWQFYHFSLYLETRHTQSFGISLINLTESLFRYLTEELHLDIETVQKNIIQDYSIEGRRDLPRFLKSQPQGIKTSTPSLTRRQQRHNH